MLKKTLVAFDFDHTIIDENSDLYVRKLAPNGEIPDHINELYQDDGWTQFMASIFKFLHENGVTPSQILDCMSEINFTEGMHKLLSFLSSDSFDVVIISDANSVFIEHIMERAGYSDLVRDVYTNPAYFSASGLLELNEYHLQDWCQLSTKNLCKGSILQNHIQREREKGTSYTTVAYVGDGTNDLCPGLKLSANDMLFPRIGFSLAKKIDDYRQEIKANIVPWSSGTDILQALKELNS